MKDTLGRIADDLTAKLAHLRFRPPVAHVYRPLEYARGSYDRYLALAGAAPKELVLFGMNPGPFGMTQTGVPFGEVNIVRDWLGIREGVVPPERQHPARPILGLDCSRSEVSGARLWGLLRQAYRTPQALFGRIFVANYCPLVFLEESGRNLTPDKLPAKERARVLAPCDEALLRTVALLEPKLVVGVGEFARSRASEVLGGRVAVGGILHPSPASPAANKDWAGKVRRQLADLGFPLPG